MGSRHLPTLPCRREEFQLRMGLTHPDEARSENQIVGTVAEIKRGDVMCEVTVDIPGGSRMASVMTVSSLDDLELKVGENVRVVVKAVNVLLVKETM